MFLAEDTFQINTSPLKIHCPCKCSPDWKTTSTCIAIKRFEFLFGEGHLTRESKKGSCPSCVCVFTRAQYPSIEFEAKTCYIPWCKRSKQIKPMSKTKQSKTTGLGVCNMSCGFPFSPACSRENDAFSLFWWHDGDIPRVMILNASRKRRVFPSRLQYLTLAPKISQFFLSL